jgi:hypothetical protein
MWVDSKIKRNNAGSLIVVGLVVGAIQLFFVIYLSNKAIIKCYNRLKWEIYDENLSISLFPL